MNFENSRFHIKFGPVSLFERVLFKMKDVKVLQLNSKHFNQRKDKRNISIEVLNQLKNFTIKEWKLITV